MTTRNGKIARLPVAIRSQLNQRLHDGELQNKLVEWLNSLPEAQAMLAAEFEGRPINEQNLSEWKAGGYRDWIVLQETIDLVRSMDSDTQELNAASQQPLTDLLARRAAARYVIVARSLGQSNGSEGDGEVDLKSLREFCADIVALRKGDHSAERLKLERERLEHDREELRKLREEEFRAWAREHRDDVCEGYLPSSERMRRLRLILYGAAPGEADEEDEGLLEDPNLTNGDGI